MFVQTLQFTGDDLWLCSLTSDRRHGVGVAR